MGFLTDLKAALPSPRAITPAIVEPGLAANVLDVARLTGLNRFGLLGATTLETAPVDNNRLLQQGYLENHYCFTVAAWKARQLAKAAPLVYQVKDARKLAKYRALKPKQKQQAYALRAKALEEIDDPDHRLVQVLRNPNPQQTWAEFAYALSVYYDFGNALVYGNRLEFGKNKGQIREMYLLPTAHYAGRNPTAAGYGEYVDSVGLNDPVAGADVLHLRQFNPDPRQRGGQLWGVSKLAAARKLLAKANSAIEAETELFANRGGRTILFPKGQLYDETTGGGVKDGTEAIRRKLRSAGAGGVAGLNVEVGSIEIGMSPVDLNILESTRLTKEDFCAVWGVDALAVFSSMNASLANADVAVKKSLFSGVLPDLTLCMEKLTRWLTPAYGPGLYIEADTDVYPELQEDKVQLAAWMADVPLTGNERRVAFGFDEVAAPGMDVPLIASRYSPVTDFELSNQTDPEGEGENDGTY